MTNYLELHLRDGSAIPLRIIGARKPGGGPITSAQAVLNESKRHDLEVTMLPTDPRDEPTKGWIKRFSIIAVIEA